MAIMRGRCGEWLILPEEALNGAEAFRRWFREFHWPHCSQNAGRIKVQVLLLRRRENVPVRVVEFDPMKGYHGLEIIPEQPDNGLWRVLNRRSQTWPIIKAGDYFDITDLDDVKIVLRSEIDTVYEPVPPPPAKGES